MPGRLSTGLLSITRQQHRALIILQNNIITNHIALCFHESLCPQDQGHGII